MCTTVSIKVLCHELHTVQLFNSADGQTDRQDEGQTCQGFVLCNAQGKWNHPEESVHTGGKLFIFKPYLKSMSSVLTLTAQIKSDSWTWDVFKTWFTIYSSVDTIWGEIKTWLGLLWQTIWQLKNYYTKMTNTPLHFIEQRK